MKVFEQVTDALPATSAVEYVDKRKKADAITLAEVDRVYSDPRPRRNHVLIKQGNAETYYAGTRFVIPESAQKAPNVGVVVSVGAKVDPIEDCKPGDLVRFSVFNLEPIEMDGETFQLCRVEDIKLVQEVTYAIGR